MAKKQKDKITYKKLLEFLLTLNEEQLECDVTVHDAHIDEFYMVTDLCVNDEDDVLDADFHAFLINSINSIIN